MVGIPKHALTALLLTTALAAGCGGDNEPPAAAPRTADAAAEPRLGAIKEFLLEHTSALRDSTADLERQGRAYYELAEGAGFSYSRLLAERRSEVAGAVRGMQRTWKAANPQYEEAEGVVAGVPELADFDVIIDAGADKSDPENAVPFDVELPGGGVLEQPGNFFFLTETSLFGTNEAFQAKDVSPDLDGNGRVAFGEAVPDAGVVMAVTRDFASQARRLHEAAQRWQPTRQDALQALVTMTPTMSEYFGQWKTSRFIAGADAGEDGFAASSRLRDIEDILSGLVTVYASVQPMIAGVDRAQAELTGRELRGLRDFAGDLRRREARGTRFTAEQADALGAESQSRAEAIAGQVSQAAAQLGIELES